MFKLPNINYEYDALGQYISADIMKLHHGKHHQTYVDKLNQALENNNQLTDRPIENLLEKLDQLPDDIKTAVRNNGGGHYNHSLFWQWMTPSANGQPTGQLGDNIKNKYGSFQNFVDEFTAKSLAIFGSGWAWLQPDLEIITTANQDNPLMQGMAAPLLGLDVWEHAYYLDYKNKRDDYIKAWWNVVDWEFVAERYS